MLRLDEDRRRRTRVVDHSHDESRRLGRRDRQPKRSSQSYSDSGDTNSARHTRLLPRQSMVRPRAVGTLDGTRRIGVAMFQTLVPAHVMLSGSGRTATPSLFQRFSGATCLLSEALRHVVSGQRPRCRPTAATGNKETRQMATHRITTPRVIDHTWIASETVRSRAGNFTFKESYPSGDAANRLKETLLFNRAIEVYLAQMPTVSWYRVWKAIADAGGGVPNQMVIWETLMDSATLLLTGNTETVYGLCSMDLKRDGAVVIELPPSMLGGLIDIRQHSIVDIGLTGVDKGNGGKLLVLPPDHQAPIPDGYIVVKSPTYAATLAVRSFQVDGKPDKAVALMKSARVYPLTRAADPPPMTFVNGSHNEIDTLFSDDVRFFD